MSSTKQTKQKASTRKSVLDIGDEARITWQDAVSKSGWTEPDSARLPLHTVISTGFVIAKEKDRITLAGCVDVNSGNVSRIHSIPNSCIRSFHIIEKKCIAPDFWAMTDSTHSKLREVKQ